jgi:hypothetical protein
MKRPKHQDRTGRLEMVCSAAALFPAAGSIAGAWSLHIVAALFYWPRSTECFGM